MAQMTPEVSKVLEKALTLSTRDCGPLIDQLIASLDDGPAEEGVEEAWAAEIKQRVDDMRSGKAKMIPGDEVIRRLGARLRMAGSKAYHVHPAAWVEIEAAADWYHEHSRDAGIWFLSTILDALESISHAPRWRAYLHDTRRFVVQRFPFSIIYLDEPEAVNVRHVP